MIELERHIEILLLSNDCVILPDLGGFMAHYVDARYDDSDGMLIPPLRTLGFNPQLTMNDSLLVQSYIEAYDLSYPEALRRIEDEVAELRQHIEAEGFYELNDIGVLRLNAEGRIEFEPCEAGILTPELYGLSAFDMPLLASKKAGKSHGSVANHLEAMAVQPEDSEETEDCATDTSDDDKEDESAVHAVIDNEPAIVIKMSWLRNAVAAAAAVLAFFLLQTPVSNSTVAPTDVQQSAIVSIGSKSASASKEQKPASKAGTTSQAPAAEAAARSEAPAVSQHVSSAKPIAEKPSAAAPVKEQVKSTAKPQPEAQKQPDTKPAYCIVLASQTTQRLAQDYVGRLKKDGHQSARVMGMQNSTKVRVVYGSYPSAQAAHNALSSLRASSSHFSEAWVLKL